MYNGGIEENRDILVETDKYTLQKVYDDRMLDYYYELWGTLDNGSSFIMRISIQGIKDNVKIFNSFIPLVGCIIIILGVVAAFVMSSYISRPITEIAGIAEKMAELNFDVKYTGNDKGEIGALGESINNMSEKLEKNISQLKAANLSLQKDIAKKEEIEQMRSGFLSNVSHELKTPIALIQGYAEGLKDGITDDPESMDFYCDVIIDEANKMNNMVKRLLTLNQIEYGQDELVIERFDLMELLNSVVNANELRAGQKDISIEFVRKDDKLDVWADEYKTEEVITNYISNAINHCDYDKKIRVYYEKRPDTVRVFVYNTGKHIPDEDIENIWVKFYKVDKARTREYGGNGIGLSIVKAIMDTYGKECGVDNVDGGVTFWFDLDAKA
jgi:signal transduction histidine kinase